MQRIEHRDRTRRALAEAAVAACVARGFDTVTVEEIADAAGVSRRTFFRYFDTKEDALFARDGELAEAACAAAQATASDGAVRTGVLAVARAMAEAPERTRAVARLASTHQRIAGRARLVDRALEHGLAAVLGERVTVAPLEAPPPEPAAAPVSSTASVGLGSVPADPVPRRSAPADRLPAEPVPAPGAPPDGGAMTGGDAMSSGGAMTSGGPSDGDGTAGGIPRGLPATATIAAAVAALRVGVAVWAAGEGDGEGLVACVGHALDAIGVREPTAV